MSNKFVIAIGSSAGGLDPMRTFFDHVPHDQATYIILRHLPIEYKSVLHDILRRHSKLEIIEAADNEIIQKDKVYMAPPSMDMTIIGDKLKLHLRVTKSRILNNSIDSFLISLAESKGKNSIAVILSGGGSDGTRGIADIKAAGGMVIAQDPETCEFPFMPESAIKSGYVDHILPVAEMPSLIQRHANSIIKNENVVEKLLDMGKNLLPPQ